MTILPTDQRPRPGLWRSIFYGDKDTPLARTTDYGVGGEICDGRLLVDEIF
tara:strand:- start:283 stop:435 length:153 start_codon:yes stop_codon:yes gene_type:complete